MKVIDCNNARWKPEINFVNCSPEGPKLPWHWRKTYHLGEKSADASWW